MNREDTKKAIEVMQAYVDGTEIENISADSGRTNYWNTGYPRWQWDGDSTTYRIKPKPREWWLNTTSSECYVTKECAEKFSGGREVVWVREVL